MIRISLSSSPEKTARISRSRSSLSRATRFPMGNSLFSASGVEAFFSALAEGGYKPPAHGRFYCIGPQTKEALFAALAADARGGLPLSEASGAAGEQEAFRERIAAAKEPTAEALARLVTDDFAR